MFILIPTGRPAWLPRMAFRVDAGGARVKIRIPWAVGVLSVVTGGIYIAVWYYKINHEIRDFGSARNDPELAETNPGVSVLAVTLGILLLCVPFVVSWVNTVRRVQRVERLRRRDPVSGGTVLVLAVVGLLTAGIVFLFAVPYLLQQHLNDSWTQDLPTGPIAHRSSVAINARIAEFGVPKGWVESTPEELATQQREENERARGSGQGDGAVIHAALYRPDVIDRQPHVIRVLDWPRGTLPEFDPEWWAEGIAEAGGLALSGGPMPVRFGDNTGYVWYLDGIVQGSEFGRPDLGPVSVWRGEMFAPTERLVVRGFAPSERANEAIDALNTFISSWRWTSTARLAATGLDPSTPSATSTM